VWLVGDIVQYRYDFHRTDGGDVTELSCVVGDLADGV
jgi:hypothetical protein